MHVVPLIGCMIFVCAVLSIALFDDDVLFALIACCATAIVVIETRKVWHR